MFIFKAGTKVYGYTYTDMGAVRVTGLVVSRTNDPEEYIQDYIIRQDDGVIVYCDEQEVWQIGYGPERDRGELK